jgi:CubicO group peptidase (beta-lactamase class C family)
MLAGTVAERLGGAPWEQLLTERVFQPLGMDCGFGAPTGPDAPLGHTADGAVIGDDDPITDNPAALGPAGTVHCPMTSWAAFAAAVLDNLHGKDSAVLGADAAADLFAGAEDYVAGWGRGEAEGQTLWSHDGSNTAWYARAVLLVERDEVLLLASNTGEQAAVDAMDRLTEAFVVGE